MADLRKIGLFSNNIDDNFSCKSSQKIGNCLGSFKNMTFKVKTVVATLWAS